MGYMYVGHKCSCTVKLLQAVLVGMASRNNPTAHHATSLKPVQKKKNAESYVESWYKHVLLHLALK